MDGRGHPCCAPLMTNIAERSAAADNDVSWRGTAANHLNRRFATPLTSNMHARCCGWQGASMLADVTTNAFPNAHVARWEHPPNPGHTG